MKYVLMIGDGMGDYPIDALGGKTPLEAAPTPNLDFMAINGKLGLARTVPEGMPPGSDVAIMSLMAYYPKGVLTGRGPLEAASHDLPIASNELVFRMNLVTLGHEGSICRMLDHSAGNISLEESLELLEALRGLPFEDGQKIFAGVSYRHLLTWPGMSPEDQHSWPPHDYLNKDVKHLLNSPQAQKIMNLTKKSWEILRDHPVNQKRIAHSLPPANSIWLWSQGIMPKLKTYQERWGIKGAAISAVDLIKGLGKVTGLERIEVEGVTGLVDTNYKGKVEAALKTLETNDYVIVHIEAPDEASHQGNLDMKLEAISKFDSEVVGPMLKGLKKFGDFKVLAACDHYTPLELRTHTVDPVPFILYSSNPTDSKACGLSYSEKNAAKTSILVDPGADLGQLLFGPER